MLSCNIIFKFKLIKPLNLIYDKIYKVIFLQKCIDNSYIYWLHESLNKPTALILKIRSAIIFRMIITIY